MSFDCRTCGACCIEAGDVWVGRLDRVPRYLTRVIREDDAPDFTKQMAKHLGGRCRALKGVIGQDCSCGIYDQRPAVCREFEPGSEGCLAAREIMAKKLSRMELRPRGYGTEWQETVKP